MIHEALGGEMAGGTFQAADDIAQPGDLFGHFLETTSRKFQKVLGAAVKPLGSKETGGAHGA